MKPSVTGAPRGAENKGLAGQPADAAPLMENGAPPPPAIVKSKRLARCRSISTGSSGLASSPASGGRAAAGSPVGSKGDQGRSVSPAMRRRRRPAERSGRRCPSRGMSNIMSNRAPGPIGKTFLQRFERFAGLAVDRDDQRFGAFDADGHDPRIGGVDETKAHPRAGRRIERQRRRAIVGGDKRADTAGTPCEARIGEVGLHMAFSIEPPVVQRDDRFKIDRAAGRPPRRRSARKVRARSGAASPRRHAAGRY